LELSEKDNYVILWNMEDAQKNKYDFLSLLLSDGDAMVCLDARRSDVSVPEKHKDDPSLNLILNLNFRKPIKINEDEVLVTLSFDGRPYECVIPFDAIWAIYEPAMKKGQVWEESLPDDIDFSEQMLGNGQAKPIKKPSLTYKAGGRVKKPELLAKRDRRHLRVIK
jgi:stringent starvation protein B